MLHPLLTHDPASGDELIVTRLECESSGTKIEGRFTLGWIGKLTPQQLDFVGLLLARRNNLQKLADDLGVAYNTARARLDDIVEAVGGAVPADAGPEAVPDPSAADRREVLDRLASGELSFDEAMTALRTLGG